MVLNHIGPGLKYEMGDYVLPSSDMPCIISVQVVLNHIGPGVTSEMVDVKEFSYSGTVARNFFDGKGEGEHSVGCRTVCLLTLLGSWSAAGRRTAVWALQSPPPCTATACPAHAPARSAPAPALLLRRPMRRERLRVLGGG